MYNDNYDDRGQTCSCESINGIHYALVHKMNDTAPSHMTALKQIIHLWVNMSCRLPFGA